MIKNDACTIVQASFTIVTYDRQNIFIIQATGCQNLALACRDYHSWLNNAPFKALVA